MEWSTFTMVEIICLRCISILVMISPLMVLVLVKFSSAKVAVEGDAVEGVVGGEGGVGLPLEGVVGGE